ncbi:hypothetical protein CC78DRAFT_575378 [Lojkania enalia]|uniref:Uncharacterized protein n=1 Tax=Lojkania enalia TaxID=147567 RepID=A0A9P4TQ79_9PLEO|nr:hypothetical protein CC78DRAFT_575378 [Didymosphaeria enalia]
MLDTVKNSVSRNSVAMLTISTDLNTAWTQDYGIWPAMIDGKKWRFVDALRFGAVDGNNLDIPENMKSSFLAIGSSTTIVGVLLHDSMKDHGEADQLKTT